MTGVDSEEGLPFATEILEQQFLIDWANRDWDDFITQVVFLTAAPHRAKNSSQKLKEFYLNNASMCSVNSFRGLSELHAARFFFVSLHHTALYHAQKAPVYLYYVCSICIFIQICTYHLYFHYLLCSMTILPNLDF
jgi:hypothetical protein